uniref:Uncharacterized protein n=1 Tax=Rhipicephalus appendiculatus TaxID=34631 RepID=A0A131YQI3_RHIAP
MATKRQLALHCTILCVFVIVTSSMKPHHGARTHSPGRPHRKLTEHDQPLCRRVSLCSKGWVQLCLTPSKQWTIFCVQGNRTCEHYWRRICTVRSVPYCNSAPKHCICACADSRSIMEAKK